MRDYLVGVTREIKKNIKLLRRQPYFLALKVNAMILAIDPEVPDFNYIRFRLLLERGAAQCGPDTCQQFITTERLGHIVVRTRIERLDLVAFFVANGKHDDGNR